MSVLMWLAAYMASAMLVVAVVALAGLCDEDDAWVVAALAMNWPSVLVYAVAAAPFAALVWAYKRIRNRGGRGAEMDLGGDRKVSDVARTHRNAAGSRAGREVVSDRHDDRGVPARGDTP